MTATHSASVQCRASTQQALNFLGDGLALGQWALGCWQTEAVGGGTVRGHSLFDDSPSWVRPVVDSPSLTVTYHVGGAPDALAPRIHATVEPDAATGGCHVTLHASRGADMDDARWLRLVRCHELEVLLIQARLDRSVAADEPPILKPR